MRTHTSPYTYAANSAARDEVLAQVQGLDPRLLVAGHAAAGAVVDASAVDADRAYCVGVRGRGCGGGQSTVCGAGTVARNCLTIWKGSAAWRPLSHPNQASFRARCSGRR